MRIALKKSEISPSVFDDGTSLRSRPRADAKESVSLDAQSAGGYNRGRAGLEFLQGSNNRSKPQTTNLFDYSTSNTSSIPSANVGGSKKTAGSGQLTPDPAVTAQVDRLNNLTSEITQSSDAMAEIRKAIAELQKELLKEQSDLKKIHEEIAEAYEKLATKKQEHHRASHDCNDYAIAHNMAQRNALTHETDAIVRHIDELKKKRGDIEKRIDDFKAKIEAKEKELDAHKNSMNEAKSALETERESAGKNSQSRAAFVAAERAYGKCTQIDTDTRRELQRAKDNVDKAKTAYSVWAKASDSYIAAVDKFNYTWGADSTHFANGVTAETLAMLRADYLGTVGVGSKRS